ncbi:MAG: hypothetical protein R2814_11910 [Flavobacteriaceae bacterium]
MKRLLTLIFVLFIGMASQANNVGQEKKVETVSMGIVTIVKNKAFVKNENNVARLYMFKNSRIKKELSFTTKLNKAKLA